MRPRRLKDLDVLAYGTLAAFFRHDAGSGLGKPDSAVGRLGHARPAHVPAARWAAVALAMVPAGTQLAGPVAALDESKTVIGVLGMCERLT